MKKFISAKMINLADAPVFKDKLFDKHGKWMEMN